MIWATLANSHIQRERIEREERQADKQLLFQPAELTNQITSEYTL